VVILLANFLILRREIARGGYDKVFLVSYAEYFAPIWAWMFVRLRRRGVVFGVVVQEPVRNFQVGPDWWHRWSISSAYGFISQAFEHDHVPLDTIQPNPEMEVHIVPMGPQKFPNPAESKPVTRARLGSPQGALVLFSFGHIRDNKNLDFAVRALAEIPNVWLLVAGKRTAESQRPESYYIKLAESLGVGDRCTWLIDYVSEPEAANLFEACDLVLLTYNRSFYSASGVLNVAAKYRKPCIASAGEGALKKVVGQFQLGVWVEPDSPEAVADGIRKWISNRPEPDWEGYAWENSWKRNAEVVRSAMFKETLAKQ
jgi:glycosyltransferase involved in cell wall biosynthesis